MTVRKKEKALIVLERLNLEIERPETELHYRTPFELLVAVVLSAQCTDKRVNLTTPALFERFPTPEAMSAADFDTLFPYIRSISYPNNKTKHLLGLSQQLLDDHGGEVPTTIPELKKLPGVGQKTANVIAAVLYKEPVIAVDTHVFRVANRLGLTQAKNPKQSEAQLLKVIPPEWRADGHHLFILHGRRTCKARTPLCEQCSLTDVCTWYRKNRKPEAV